MNVFIYMCKLNHLHSLFLGPSILFPSFLPFLQSWSFRKQKWLMLTFVSCMTLSLLRLTSSFFFLALNIFVHKLVHKLDEHYLSASSLCLRSSTSFYLIKQGRRECIRGRKYTSCSRRIAWKSSNSFLRIFRALSTLSASLDSYNDVDRSDVQISGVSYLVIITCSSRSLRNSSCSWWAAASLSSFCSLSSSSWTWTYKARYTTNK